MTAAAPRAQSDAASWLALKIFALVVMLVDHVDWLLFAGTLGLHDTIGRTVFPLFALVLGRNLARADAVHMLAKVAPRMAVVGLAAAVPYLVLAGPFPLNVMFTLAAAVAMHAAWRLGNRVTVFWGFLLAGFVVDYQWFGLACVLISAWAFQRAVHPALQLVAMSVLLWPFNGSWWALAAVPAYLLCAQLSGPAPRLKWLFYAFYPAHLAVLAAIAFH